LVPVSADSMAIVVRRFEGTAAEWDGFGRTQRGWTAFHRLAWREVIERSVDQSPSYRAAFRGDRLEGILPLVRVKSALFGHYLVSVPFVNYGGPVGTDEAVRALAEDAAEQARSERVKLLELRSRVELPVGLPVSHRKITVVLDLPPDTESLMKGFPAKLRSQVRRPFKDGMSVRFGPSELEPFYRVFAEHMRDLGTPVMPRRFFEAIRDGLGDDVWFGCAYLGEEPVAGGVALGWDREIEITWAAALGRFNRISPNMGLYFGFMERAIGLGFTRFNFGRCSPDSGTHRYKRQWGGKDQPLWWYQFSSAGVEGTPSPDGAYSWGPRLWKRLPLPLANWIGPKIVRSIP
jgi:FemAB-related protein (PEP-CTERM system-associated)